MQRRRPPPSRVSTERVRWKKPPSASLFERGREGGGLWEGDDPLRLTRNAREGDGGGLGNSPSILCFE